jgi:peptide/nickel transport system ATP-binding protein
MNLLEVRDLAVEFRIDETTRLRAVKGVSFEVPVRSTVALVGESGSGKSVSALSVVGLLPKENATIGAGSRILYRGRDLLTMGADELRRVRGKEIAMIFQEPMSSLNPVFSVGFQIGEVLRKHLGLSGRALRERTVELLNEVGIREPRARLDVYPFQLSGGQQQRVMIAMAIACEPKLLIADEPTTALDVTVQRQIMDLMAKLQERHEMAMLFITHDLALVREIADYVVVMRHGEVREQAAASQLFRDPRDAYTKALLACRPPLDHRPWRLPVIDDFISDSGTEPELLRSPATIVRAPSPNSERPRGLRGDEPTLLEAHELAKSFYFREGLLRQRELKAVKGASFRIAKGKTLGVVGESGSGKTTVALLVARLHQASGGEVRFEGRDLLKIDARAAMPYKRRIQIVFQNPYASLNPRFTVGQILAEPLQIHGIGANDDERRAMALDLLAKVGLPADSAAKYPHEFSGGQRQRIAIARALTLKPELLICDESVSALDVSVQAQLLNLLQDLQDEYAMSYLFISHDLAVVRYMADEVMVMKDGEVVEIAGPDELYANPKHPYTRLLLSSIPGRTH